VSGGHGALALDAESKTLAKQYESLSRLSISLASLTPEELSRNLAALLRPLLDFDFFDVIVFKQGTSEVLWHSVEAGRFLPADVPIEETTLWWVYQQQQALCIADWRLDDRFAVRREALKRMGIEYRSLCRLTLRTLHGPLGVFSIASYAAITTQTRKYASCRW
jgi:GAF domain-containing protein